MVVALGPGKFYGSSLPRPRYFSDVKLNDERVDPPVPVLDPLLSWAKEAHWSMGGYSFQRYRLQGRIEGSIKKLRVQHNRADRKKAAAKFVVSGVKPVSLKSLDSDPVESVGEIAKETVVVSPPRPPKKKRARKLMDEFEMVAGEESTPASHEVLGSNVIENDNCKNGSSDVVVLMSPQLSSEKTLKKDNGDETVLVSPQTPSRRLLSGSASKKVRIDDAVFVTPRTRSQRLSSVNTPKIVGSDESALATPQTRSQKMSSGDILKRDISEEVVLVTPRTRSQKLSSVDTPKNDRKDDDAVHVSLRTRSWKSPAGF